MSLLPLLPAATRDRDGADATYASVLGVGERLSIRIDAPREGVAGARVAAGEGAAGNAAAIHIAIRHLGATADVNTPTAHPVAVGHLGRRSSPRSSRGSAISRSDRDRSNSRSSRYGCGGAISPLEGGSSSSDLEGDHQTLDKKPRQRAAIHFIQEERVLRVQQTQNIDALQDELQGVFDILVLVLGSVVPIALLAYTLLHEDNPSAQRIAWITLGTVVGSAAIGAVISRLAVTERAAEASSAIGLVCTIALIIISEIVLVECLPFDFWSLFWAGAICLCLLIGAIYAWTECAGRPKWLRRCIRGCPGCFYTCLMGLISFCVRQMFVLTLEWDTTARKDLLTMMFTWYISQRTTGGSAGELMRKCEAPSLSLTD
ncbi:hypothetical protein ACP70R_015635 [Stipagrostis hirtigluma subsp. patula]